MKALAILEQNQPIKERASEFIKSIKRNIKKDVIDELESTIEKLEDKLFSLSDMTVATDVNQGVIGITRDQAEQRFKDIIDTEYELSLVQAELKIKKKSFAKYFKEEVKAED
jgi:AraC-like DNA-binding protein